MARTRHFGLIGDPVSHSLSPFIMHRAFEAHAIDADYEIMETHPAGIARRIDALRTRGFSGINVTYPLKEAVLSEVDETTSAVAVIGAVNTLEFGDGVVRGHNTDAIGAALAMKTLAADEPAGKHVLVYGAGGVGRAAAYGLLAAGAATLTFAVRDQDKTEDTLRRMRRAFPEQRVCCYDMRGPRGGDAPVLEDMDVIINATPVGMHGFDASAPVADGAAISAHHLCFEFVYDPLATPFLRAATRRGARTLDGVALLVAQAHAAFEIWTGKTFSIPQMYDAAAGEAHRER